MEGTSYLVWAERYKYDSLKSLKDGTYKTDGSKTKQGEGFVVRSFAVDRNAANNNEVYIFNEEKTSELMLVREENIKKQAKEAEKKTKSMEDVLAEAIVKAGKTAAPVDEELEELIEKAEELGIVLKGRKTIKSVQAKIDAKLNE